MNILRWILAFPIAAFSWLYFPYLVTLIVFPAGGAGQGNIYHVAILFFLNPILSLGTLFLVLPPGKRPALVTGIIAFSIVLALGSILLWIVAMMFSPNNPSELVFFELVGTIVGARLAYVYVPLKSREISN